MRLNNCRKMPAALILALFCTFGCQSTSENSLQSDSVVNEPDTKPIDLVALKQSAEQTMQRYLLASMERYDDDAAVQKAIFDSQQQWLNYLNQHCQAEYLSWSGASVQNEQRLLCEIELTQLHTIALWRSFLTFEDSTPPILPQPKN